MREDAGLVDARRARAAPAPDAADGGDQAAEARRATLRIPRWAARAGVAPAIAAWHVRVWVVAVISVVAIGTTGYLLAGWSFSDALYMTGITITTVGYREVRELGEGLRLWTMLLALSGVGLIFGLVGIVGEALVSEATSGRREARRMRQAVDRLRDHFVLCGYGRVGTTVAQQLRRAGQQLVVVDILPESLERARRDGYLIVEGDATDDATLKEAGIERARGLITTIDSDALNVYVILAARAFNPEMLVVGRASTASAEARLAQAGAHHVVSPYTMAGRRLAQLAVRPRVVQFIDAALEEGELAFSIEEIEVAPGGALESRSVGQLREEGLFVLAIVPGPGRYEPHPGDDRRLQAGEGLIVSGSVDALARAQEPGQPAARAGGGH